MKKIALVVVLFLGTLPVFAQFRFGVKAGANFSNWTVKFGDEKDDDYASRTGYHFGFIADKMVSENFSIQPQLLYVSKGSKYSHDGHTDQIVMNAIDVPLNFLYHTSAGKGKFFIGGGPNFGFNLGGTLKSDEEGDEDIEVGSGAGEFEPFEFGLNLLTGYELKSGLFISANYTPGLSNIGNGLNDFSVKSSYFGISLGYFFKGTSK